MKGILAFTFDDHEATKMEKRRAVASSQTKGVINELLEVQKLFVLISFLQSSQFLFDIFPFAFFLW